MEGIAAVAVLWPAFRARAGAGGLPGCTPGHAGRGRRRRGGSGGHVASGGLSGRPGPAGVAHVTSAVAAGGRKSRLDRRLVRRRPDKVERQTVVSQPKQEK